MLLFWIFSLVKAELPDDSLGEHVSFSSTGAHPIAMIIMFLSLALLLGFYGYHLRRIMKEITTVSPMFDIAETETKMEFTIAERGTEEK
ncbi:hypothetical protein TVAG_238170 [Trichomonas vaginalis G3]|uniref:Uncharacterized protein n=1 Tax=Trichomonas vaginalis (strain ATCC PRA-98 / G3) TaxID=412133 RepID=A2DD17_TRIV3|nr:hypothetical protein TVAGG3_0578170 [Trichomonas vaginalis G3]EAY21791.1 hypothetical protein TVAG_238170 [Trichomonas vaginalis G3]KAI5522372.1 hypothetical protein TVAGG3_0578170 [Trichomonas vaginalis G3]|eukprot:XP_001582777.1 hypothetical protein [Trichomonas vaginalis G3]